MAIRSAWLAAGILLIAASAGCGHSNYRILTDLPEPPSAPGLQDTGSCPGSSPAGAASIGGLTPLTAGQVCQRPAPDPNMCPWEPDVRSIAWRHIVIHHSATDNGSAASFDRLHRLVRQWDELGYHFVIGNGRGSPDGCIEVGSRWYKQKWGAHCGGTPNNEYNEFGIGICLVGDFTRQAPTPQQLAALTRLTKYLAARYHIPPEQIIGHRQAPNANTECPGDKLLVYVVGTLRKEIANDQSQ
jgi:hypothetical protein